METIPAFILGACCVVLLVGLLASLCIVKAERPHPVGLDSFPVSAAHLPTIFAAPRMVVVNTKKPDDQSLRGQMVDDGQQSGWVVLRAPALHVAGEATSSWEKLPADVSIPLGHVAWIIDVPAEADAVV